MKRLKILTSILLITSLASCDALDDLLNEEEETEEFEDFDEDTSDEKKEDKKEETKDNNDQVKEEEKKEEQEEKEEKKQTYTSTFYSAPGVVYATVTKNIGESVYLSDLGRDDEPVKESDKEGHSYLFTGWNELVDGQIGNYYTFDDTTGMFGNSESKKDVSYLAKFRETRDAYFCDFCSYTGEKLFDMRVLYDEKPSESTQYTGGYSKYYEPSYSEDGKKYTFVGWSTTKGDSASNAISFNNLPAIKKKETYYAIYNRSSYTNVFIELTGEETNGKYTAYSFNEAKTNNYITLDGSKLTRVNENNFAYDLYGMTKPYNLYLSNNSITTIGSNSLSLISSAIRKLSISSITSIEENGFSGFNNSGSIQYDSLPIDINGANVTSLSSGAFRDCGKIGEFSFPKLSTIPTNCFENCSLEYAKIPDNITKIDQLAFKSCKSLKKIHIGKDVSNIAFTTTSVKQNPFWDSPYIEEVTVDSNNSTYKASNNAIIRKSDNTLILGSNGTTTIPSGVTKIDSYAFISITRLYDQTITIPTSVTSIESNAFYGVRMAKINYLGTKQQFQNICKSKIVSGLNTNYSSAIKLDCTDAKDLTLKNVVTL